MKAKELPRSKKQDENKFADVKIHEFQLGIWNLKIASDASFNWKKRYEDFKISLPLLGRVALDVFRISPGYFIIFIFCQFWVGIEQSFLLQQSNNLLQMIEAGISTGKPNSKEISKALVSRVVFTIVFSYFHWYGDRVLEILQNRVTRYYELALIEAKLGMDLQTSQAPQSQEEFTAGQAWDCLQQFLSFHTTLVRVASLLFLIIQVSRSAGGPFFTLLCASQPICSVLFSPMLWNEVCFGFINNIPYYRIRSLQKLLGLQFRQDIISGGLAQWIIDEYRRASEELGNLSQSHPYIQYESNKGVVGVLTQLLSDLPMVYCGINAIVHPTKFTISSVAILQQSSFTLRGSFMVAVHETTRFRRNIARIKNMYSSLVVVKSMDTGSTPYPHIPEKPSPTVDITKGMSFQLSNVAFSYSGSQSQTPALKDISLAIKPGQLVIIVGANGSGKSTLIRILARLYDPTSGEVHIDGLPSSQYKIDDLHQATSLLSQDSRIYSLSLAENIGLGYPARAGNADMIAEAAQKGGASEFMKKLNDGMETVLDPAVETFQHNLTPSHPLYKETEKIRKPIDISGGEKQRVIASRSFMRFKSGKVKFVAVDEPSSALDAEGELGLFTNLLTEREGKTMIFVTHRFGHLTKHADLVLCMKEGSIAESGTHIELMAKNGEYANLYNIQASAFSNLGLE